MSLLIINTVDENNIEVENAISELTKNIEEYKVINTFNLNISHCTGCGECMLSTPGKCCINDDFEDVLKASLICDDIVFVSEMKMNFISANMVKVIQRLFPLITIFSCYKNGEIRHVPRYEKTHNCFLLYRGNLDKTLLNDWFNLCMSHLGLTAKGVFSIYDVEGYKCILQ